MNTIRQIERMEKLRDYGARIAYSSVRKTYYYLNDFEIIFNFEIKVSC